MPNENAKIQIREDGALICPACGRAMDGIRIYPDTRLTRANVRCPRCKRTYDVTIQSGPRHIPACAIV